MSLPSIDTSVAATFCATFVDEWVRGGVTDVVVCPGSRSTPLALALDCDERIRVHVHPDERSGGFMALGIAMATGRPTVVLTTSGTAAVELFPAIVEADLSMVPIIACTADRPAELHDVGAPQTIDQVRLFGHFVRGYFDPGPPEWSYSGSWRSLAAHVVLATQGDHPGPVHLNLPFREPLVGNPGTLPTGRDDGAPWHATIGSRRVVQADRLDALVAMCRNRRGVIIAGEGLGCAESVLALGRRLGWPVFADPRSGCRVSNDVAVAHFDPILRVRGAAGLYPDLVLSFGRPPASKVLEQWLVESGCHRIAVEAAGRWFDPSRDIAMVVHGEPEQICEYIIEASADHSCESSWLSKWLDLDSAAASEIAKFVDREDLSEPAVARILLNEMSDGSRLVVSSSMPIRDLEWFGGPTDGVRVLANRGANGIDGVVSTAVGIALAGAKTALLIGDLAFVHDANGLIGVLERDIDLTIVVIDNGGGGIFSFLPQAKSLPAERFERLFGTPHGVGLVKLAEAHCIEAVKVETNYDLREVIRRSLSQHGVKIVIAQTTRESNVVAHHDLNAAVNARVESVLLGETSA